MTNEINRNAEKYQKQHHRRSIWHRALSLLSAVTVFITTYALILPAITMEPAPGIRLDNAFQFETDTVVMEVKVAGRAIFENPSEALPTASAENVILTVTPLEEKSSVYAAYQRYAEEYIASEDLRELLMLRLSFSHQGAKLNTDSCDIEINVVTKSSQVNKGPLSLFSQSGGVVAGNDALQKENLALTAFQGVNKDIAAQDTAYQDEDGNIHLKTKIQGNTLGLALYATVNPGYTVQYYANITMLDESNSGSSNVYIPVIDTSGGKLPSNGVTPAKKNIHLQLLPTGGAYRMASVKVLQPLYSSKTLHYFEAPTMAHMDRLYGVDNYTVSEIWVLKDGKSSTSTNRNDWTIYKPTATNPINFTNRADSASANRIYIADGTVLRFVYNESSGYHSSNADFFDYDISNGYYTEGGITYMATSEYGINSFSSPSNAVKLAFGNVNTGTKFGTISWTDSSAPAGKRDQQLNKYNENNSNAGGCTFGLVVGLDANGQPVFASGVAAPDMFSPQNGTGKTYYDDYYLRFARNGDNYVLSSVNAKSNGEALIDNLALFHNPSYIYNGTTEKIHTGIFTNDFWPMDNVATAGAAGHDMIFGDYTLYKDGKRKYKNGSTTGNLPPGDDSNDHNSYFGMSYKINFTLDADYVGPLEYMFYGDDDMWVFLDGQLVCDIGGVHSSVGQYVNLRDYLPVGSSGEHTLSFFYTERGASGSTCYMQFTLPSVDGDLTTVEPNTLELNKVLDNATTTQEFEFTVDLLDAAGDPLVDDYSYTRYDTAGTVIENGILNSTQKTVKLRGGEKLTVDFLPDGAQFKITELKYPGFFTTYRINGGTSTPGYTAEGNVVKNTTVTFINSSSTPLPATGGVGIWLFCIPLALGFGMMILKAPLEHWWETRKKRE